MKLVQNRYLKKRIMIDSSSVLIDLCKFLSLFFPILFVYSKNYSYSGYTLWIYLFRNDILIKATKYSYLNQENLDVVPFTAQIQ